jgi:hypothetical protein
MPHTLKTSPDAPYVAILRRGTTKPTQLVLQPGGVSGFSTTLTPRLLTRSAEENNVATPGHSVSIAGWLGGATAEYELNGKTIDSDVLVFNTPANAQRVLVAVGQALAPSTMGHIASPTIGPNSDVFTNYYPVISSVMLRTVVWRKGSVVGSVMVSFPESFPATAAITLAQAQSRRAAVTAASAP